MRAVVVGNKIGGNDGEESFFCGDVGEEVSVFGSQNKNSYQANTKGSSGGKLAYHRTTL